MGELTRDNSSYRESIDAKEGSVDASAKGAGTGSRRQATGGFGGRASARTGALHGAAGVAEPGRSCVGSPGGSVQHLNVTDRAAEPVGRASSTGSGQAARARRERQSRLGLFGLRRPAGPASSPSFPGFLSRLPRAAARLALAALLLAGAAGVGSPAIAQTTHWSATLTADEVTHSGVDFFGCDNSDPSQDNCSLATVLTHDDFTYEGTTYTVALVYWSSDNQLTFGLDGLTGAAAKTALSSLVLEVDGTDLLFSSANTEDTATYWSYNPATDWADGTTVALKVKSPDTAPTVDKVAVTSRPHAGTPGALKYGVGQKIQITVMFDVSGIWHAEDADCALVSIPEDLTVTAFEGAVNAPVEIDCEYDAHKEEGA